MKSKKVHKINKKRLFLLALIAVMALCFTVYGGAKFALKFFYPTKYEEFVADYSEEFGVDPYLVFAVIRSESKFKEDAVSRAGAAGLMQLMEKTAEECIGELGETAAVEMMITPKINIKLGTYYLSKLLEKYGGDVQLAVAAYNCGPGEVDSWLRNERYYDAASGVLKEVPIKETEIYIKNVQSAYRIYRKLYE